VLLIRHGASAAVRAVAFGSGERLDAAARDRARELAGSLPRGATGVAGPEPVCGQTADCLGLAADVVGDLAACDVGCWRGLTLDVVQTQDPRGLMAWMGDPDAAPHGGESLTGFSRRVARWMVTAGDGTGFLVAVVDVGVVKAAVCEALGAPLSAFWRLDVAPLAVTELHARDGRWTVRHVNAPLAREGGVCYVPA
jgi:broad specificity phosphatase PhoE